MDKKTLRQNLILAIAAAALLWGIVALVFDFYYDLNDDVLIKDIISGIYTGRPDAHNNQMMYPLSLFFALLYSCTGRIPWFGLVEIGCFIASFVIILKALLGKLKLLWQRIAITLIFTIVFASIYIWEIVMLQYTVVSGMLCTAATAIVYGHESVNVKEKAGDYLRSMLPALVILILAFNFRSEMFLLMCPFMAAAGLARWLKEKPKTDEGDYKGIFDICNIKKYFSLIGTIIAVVILTTMLDKLAYSGADWKEFRRFFDARTDVYDFTGIPDYEANRAFYESQGIEYEQYKLLTNYNFALDDMIGAEKLETIADFARSGKALNTDGSVYSRTNKSLRTTLGEYIHNITDNDFRKEYDASTPFADEAGQFAPFGIVVMLLYVALFVAAFYEKKWQLYITMITLMFFRSISWIFIFQKGRIVPRITHPMYFIEIVILMLILTDELSLAISDIKKNGKTGSSGPEVTATFCCITAVSLMIICFGCANTKWSEVKEKAALRDELNEQSIALNNYISQSAAYYHLDVYSTVDWTERVFEEPVSKQNQELAGGWMAFSPLNSQKEAASVSTRPSLIFVTRENKTELSWMSDWFAKVKGKADIECTQLDIIEGKNSPLNIFEIYY